MINACSSVDSVYVPGATGGGGLRESGITGVDPPARMVRFKVYSTLVARNLWYLQF